jgi:hypothetical protein
MFLSTFVTLPPIAGFASPAPRRTPENRMRTGCGSAAVSTDLHSLLLPQVRQHHCLTLHHIQLRRRPLHLPQPHQRRPTTMAFVNASISATITPVRASSKVCAVRGSPAVAATPRRAARAAAVRMADQYPTSDVLGLGKEVPSSLYAIASGPAFLLGCWSVYQSNFAHTLSAGSVEYVRCVCCGPKDGACVDLKR